MGKYWLAENGIIRCLDEACPQECDMGCPIYLQTLAISLIQQGQIENGIVYLEQAVKIEPTFAEAWNNLAACYGQLGNHQRAFECYSKSFDLHEKPNPLYGMAVAMKNLGRFNNAMQYVKMYESRYGKDDRINSVQAEIAESQMEQSVRGNMPGKNENNTASAKQNSPDKATSEKETVMREYGRQYLLLFDKTTRERGYAELEKLERSFPEAGVVVGQYYQGQGQDLQRAAMHFKAAADAGIAEGQWSYSQLLQHSYILDLSKAEDKEYLKYCLMAAEGGCSDAANEMGNICHRKGYYAESTYWYGMAYALEHPAGMISLRGIAKEWQQQGISKEFTPHLDGFTEGRHSTALILNKMFICPLEVDDLEELHILTLQGENLAGFILAKVFEQQNHDDMAYEIYNTLAFEKHPYALRCYADMLFNGKGTAKDMAGAFRMYKLSAERGDATAMFVMGQKAVKEGDLLMAACWFGQAYSRGLDMAGDWLVKIASSR